MIVKFISKWNKIKNEFYENDKTLYPIFKYDIKYEDLFLTSDETIYKYKNKS